MKAKKNLEELRQKTEAELRTREHELSDQLFALRLQKATGQLEKPSKVREAKREMARVLTVIGEKRRAGKGEGQR